MRIEMLVDAIEDAIKKKCFLPALAMTLVLPDICGQYDYKKIYDKKERYNDRTGQGAAYEKWYDNNILPTEKPDYEKSDMSLEAREAFQDLADKTTLTGRHLWKLRCGFLHEGAVDLDKEMCDKDTEVHFKLIATPFSNFEYTLGGISGASKCGDTYEIEVDIVQLCGKILAVLKHSYISNPDFIEKTDMKKINYKEIHYEPREISREEIMMGLLAGEDI